MSSDPLDAVLEKLCAGDPVAAEQVFRAYEPYLRMVVRRLLPSRLRCKFDSMDVVQSAWADILDGFKESGWRFENTGQLKAFLIKVTRNRFIDRVRRHRTAVQKERSLQGVESPLIVPTDEPRPSELAQADELWRDMLLLCPAAHRELLQMKRDGHSLAEIAERTGLHASSVRRILYDLARRLAKKRQAKASI
jgi:RNA polymerase sigma-70 factor (ECF subfamily)